MSEPGSTTPRQSGPTLLLISGTGRSGTTLIGNILGQSSQCCHVGELSFFLGQFDPSNRICGCGRSISQCASSAAQPAKWCPRVCGCGDLVEACPFWQTIADQAFGSTCRPPDAQRLGQFSVAGMRHTPRALSRFAMAPGSDRMALARKYAQSLRDLYTAIADLTGSSVVVDSSKRGMHIYLAARLTGLPAYILHIVRDPRALTHSWRRRATDQVVSGPGRVAINWGASNIAAELAARRAPGSAYRRLRYEDFVSNPRTTIEAIGADLSIADASSAFLDDHRANIEAHHTIAGSPSRFRTGPIDLAPDDEWRSATQLRETLLSTLFAAPLLPRYGYQVRP